MKNLSLLIWLTQLGMSVAIPIGGFVLLSVWLQRQFSLGSWIIFCGVALGLICAINGIRTSLQTMKQMAKNEEENKPVSFNDHM